MSEKRRHFTPAEKLSHLKRHLLEGVSVSSICDELDIKPTSFYQWKKQFFDNGEASFASSHTKNKAEERQQQRTAKLEAKLRKKDEIIAIITEEPFQLKNITQRPYDGIFEQKKMAAIWVSSTLLIFITAADMVLYKITQKAVRWYLIGERSSTYCKHALGNIYATGTGGIEQNHPKSMEWYLQAAKIINRACVRWVNSITLEHQT